MKRILLIIALALTASTLCFSATGKGYRILDHEVHVSPGSNFHVEEIEPGSAKKLAKQLKNNCPICQCNCESKHNR